MNTEWSFLEFALALLFPLLFTLVAVPLYIRFTRRLGLVDEPHQRGMHTQSMPTAGGLAFALPYLIAVGYLMVVHPEQGANPTIPGLLIGSICILFLGLADDRWRLSGLLKLGLQIMAITIAYVSGLRVEQLTNPLDGDIMLGFLSFPITQMWFLVVINAINLIDGIDGVAAGIVMIVGAVLTVSGIIFHNYYVIFTALALTGVAAGFLRYNFHPARLFMGDAGSMFLGFNIAAIPVIGLGQIKGITAMTLLVPILVLFVPLLDTATSIMRRVQRRAPLLTGDKHHLHHRLMEFGLSQRGTACVIYFVTFLFGLIAIGYSFTTRKVLMTLLICLAVVLAATLIILYRKAERIYGRGTAAKSNPEDR
jgi:UDP-GlcNAc:undecaprenyl-phosphate/decaprenyl-phosphate GlcNAc-1-phosphate transferase